MKRDSLLLMLCLLASVISGCAKPDQVTTVKSPIDGVFYTVETYYGHGPTSDTTRVYAHLERPGIAKKMLVLEGENLTIAKITWDSPQEATFCLDGGITETFRNAVSPISGDTSVTIHNQINEHCNSH